jgi:predicted transcriptional regulator
VKKVAARVDALEVRVSALEARSPGMSGAELRTLRLAAKLSLRALAAKLGISHVSVFDLEQGARPISVERAEKIREACR